MADVSDEDCVLLISSELRVTTVTELQVTQPHFYHNPTEKAPVFLLNLGVSNRLRLSICLHHFHWTQP
ncbi:hypothetical protein LMH87_002257 [Akanthomyces muscarius]|uniref:Uncharacterized protein n=1 Tax=Akanthomyces muscarius TaxID=2231603 RepID=A0A9W8Q979_AKAMU|nr:hypothetical protein LMH87_002257 [Akanthomyces muscarius]KAJ4147751.1 hypothetical protein LMH87_002257 [Akanthomyces muscarius]